MCFWKNLAKFVGMKQSIDFLPERKQRDLHELVGLIRDEVKDVVMIILYGSMPATPMLNWIYGGITAVVKSNI